jgi:hopanoid C-3 methylase
MKVLLVKPSPRLETIRTVHGLIFLEPLELGYIAAAVPPGHDVRVLDLRLAKAPDRAFARELRAYRPDVVGLSGYTHEASQVIALSRTVRAVLPQATVVVGGHHATVLPATYNVESIDAIVRGEGCAPFRAVIEAKAAGRPLTGLPEVLVPGDAFDAAHADELPRYPNLDDVPNPRRDLWDPKAYHCVWFSEAHPDWKTIFPPVALVRSSFGCQMNCTFCVVPRLCGGRHMKRSPDRVAEEIAGLPVEHIYFCDDETFMDADHARALAEAIEARGVRKRYFAWARSTTVNRSPEVFRQWRRIGLDAVFLGFEAVTDEELRALSKHSTVADNARAHAALREMGIAVQAGFMVRPEFTRDDFARLRQTLRAMPPAQVTLTIYTPSPCSPAWYAERGQFVCDPHELHDCMHPLTRTALPLREFYREFASLVWAGGAKSPLRARRSLVPPWDLVRVWWAVARYSRALKRAYRDFPRELW